MDVGKEFFCGYYDNIVIGAGHAGCEAGIATAKMGKSTLVLTMSLDSIALLACNPSIGGTGKGHLVKEIDALGGEMALNTDKTTIQSRVLNTSKGPAVHSLRVQTDRFEYQKEMKYRLENQENLDLRQGEVIEILTEENIVVGVKTRLGAIYKCKTVILATGTYLNGRIYIGEVNYEGGPNGLFPSRELSYSLKDLGIKMRRFKTGTPARIHKKSIDYSKVEEQLGDSEIIPFSFMTESINLEQTPCYLTYTNEKTHNIIMENLYRSPMYSGEMESTGPRYCPSIEDKIVRFSDKKRHQVFIEPEGKDTAEMYLQGVSTTFPEDVLIKMLDSISGIENAKIMRGSYAIEYDCIDPTQLKRTLEYKEIDGLFFAGQINGTSGYEEAASQGLIAGINASLKIDGLDSFVIDRSEGYIGILIDDLVTKGTNEPYRMMTSRSEYRLLQRQDNADLRLTEKGYSIGLVTEERYNKFILKKSNIENEISRLESYRINPTKEINVDIVKMGIPELKNPTTLMDLLKRPELNYDILEIIDKDRLHLTREEKIQVETQIKYSGYIDKQIAQVEQFKKLENKRLSKEIDYEEIKGLRLEARQKLNLIKPESVGQASRVSGVSPADINVLLIYLEQQRRMKK